MNLGIWNKIKTENPDVVILMAWVNITWWIAILACIYHRIPFLYMTDSNIAIEESKPRWKRWIKRVLLSKLIFPVAAGFLCSGSANRVLYSHYGVGDEKLFPFAYSWGYDALREKAIELNPKRDAIRERLGINKDQKVILYCGRLSPEKNLHQLIKAYENVDCAEKLLVFVGDGPLRTSLETVASELEHVSIRFFGFQNRQSIPEFYAAADLLVLPSTQETWGIVVNEALCFGLPIVASDQVGAAPDLISGGNNGFIFPSGDIAALTRLIEKIVNSDDDAIKAFRERSVEIIDSWLDRNLGDLLIGQLYSIR